MKSTTQSRWISALGAGALFVLAQCLVAVGITRDIPVGGLTGSVVMKENGRPLSGSLVAVRSMSAIGDSSFESATAEVDSDGNFAIRGLPAGSYALDISANCHSLPKEMLVQVAEGKATKVHVEAIPSPDELRIGSPERVYLPEEQPRISIYGHFAQDKLTWELKRAPLDALLSEGDIYRLYSGSSNSKAKFEAIKSGELKLTDRDIEGQFELKFPLDKLAQGLYIFEGKQPDSLDEKTKKTNFGLRSTAFFYVSKIGAIVKKGSEHLDAFIVDLKTGEPVQGAITKHYVGTTLKQSSQTDALGLARFNKVQGSGENAQVVVATSGDATAIVNFSEYESNDGVQAHFITDRPIYRPGDDIHFKAILREPQGEAYRLPSFRSVHINVSTSQEDTVFDGDVPVNEFGTVLADFRAPKTEGEGLYVTLSAGEYNDSFNIPVTAYRKPEFKIEVTPEKATYYRGEVPRFKVKANYFFGSPVANAKIEASVYGGELWAWHDSVFDDPEESSYDDEYMDTIEATTDANGEAIIEVPNSLVIFDPLNDVDRSVTLKLTVGAGNNRFAEGEGQVSIRRGSYDLRVQTSGWYIQPQQPLSAEFTALSVETGKPVPNLEVAVEYGPTVWVDSHSVMHKEGLRTLTTDQEGKVTLRITPEKEGFYEIKARVKDPQGRAITAIDSFACLTDAYDGDLSGNEQGLSILLDKKAYKPGQDVRAMIIAPGKHGKAWVTMEGLDVMQQSVVDLRHTMTPVMLKVPSVAAPNAFVAVSLIRDKAIEQAGKSVKIGLDEKALNVELTPAKSVLKPGETTSLHVSVKDATGKPVSSELSLGVVDEAVYSIMEDDSDPLDTFYPKRWSGVPTYDSFPVVYLDGGEKGAKNVDIRKDFRDTAEWVGRVVTNSAGQADVKIKLPDNLTSWRFTANAITKDTKTSKAKVNVKVRKELMIRLATPVQLIAGDLYEIVGTINSDVEQPQSVTASLKVEGGVKIVNGADQKVELSPKGEALVKWQISATTIGTAKLTGTAISSSFSDGMEIQFPVLARNVFEGIGGFGILRDATPEDVTPEIGKAPATVSISLDTNPQDTLADSLAYLIRYPYGCVEQTLSTFVPAVVYKSTNGTATLPADVNVDEVIEKGIARISLMQHSDGGWGWWENDQSSPWMTGMVLEGLFHAKNAGVKFPERLVNMAMNWGKSNMEVPAPKEEWSRKEWARGRSYLAYGMSLNGQSHPILQEERVKDEGLEGLSLRYLANCRLNNAVVADKLYQLLRDQANVAAGRIDWAAEGWGHSSGPRILEGMAILHPDHQDLPAITAGILGQRSRRYWVNTYDTAQSVRALTIALGGKQPTQNTVVANVTKNGSIISTETNPTRRLMDVVLSPGDKLQFSKQGEGVLFYSWNAQVPTKSSIDQPATSEKGLSIERTFHKLISEKQWQNDKERFEVGPATTTFKPGDTIVCRVRVKSSVTREYFLVDVPLPANVSVISDAAGSWYYWYGGKQVFDDRVALFSTWMSAGDSTFEILLRAESNSKCTALPAQFERMYVPSINARTAATTLEVKQ